MVKIKEKIKLFHYYDKSTGPFMNISCLNKKDALYIQNCLKSKNQFFASKRKKDYIEIRFELEKIAREKFILIGGKPNIERPYTMTLRECCWLKSWYSKPLELSVDITNFDPSIISFTYGDLFPAFKYNDGEEHYQKVYYMNDLPNLIQKYGLPQVNNPDGILGPKRYIEAQIWDERVIKDIRNKIHFE